MDVYYLGGSPCGGKSTVAELLAANHGFSYYKLDDRLFDFMAMAARDEKPRSERYFALTSDEIWMRPPEVQLEDEVGIYREMFDYLCADLAAHAAPAPVIAEGAGFLPELMHRAGVEVSRYFCLVPTGAFQMEHYPKREFIAEVLRDCSEKETAFDHWMKRDMLFAEHAAASAKALGYASLWVDGTLTPEAVLAIVERQFLLPSCNSGK